MKHLALVLNALVLVTIAYQLFKYGLPHADDAAWAILFTASAIASIVALWTPGEGWLSLYLKRKALEERRKIAALEAKPEG